MAKRDEDELIGHVNRPGALPATFDDRANFLTDSGAEIHVEDNDNWDPVDVEQNPFIQWSVDEDGNPGNHPFVDAARDFDIEQGLLPPEERLLDSSREEENGDEVLGDEFAHHLEQRDAAAVGDVSDIAMLARVG